MPYPPHMAHLAHGVVPGERVPPEQLEWREYTFPSGALYRGGFVGTRKEGRGWWRHPSGETYEGQYLNNQQEGWGIYRFADTGKEYRGQWVQGEMSGKGLYLFEPDGSEYYIGDYQHDRKHGSGLYQYRDGRMMHQVWRDGVMLSEDPASPRVQFDYFSMMTDVVEECDKAGRNETLAARALPDIEREFDLSTKYQTHTFPSGCSYAGDFLLTKKHGTGLWRHPDGDWYDGQFRYNRHWGWGVYVIGKSLKKYVGCWRDGKMHGWGIYYFTENDTEFYIGQYRNDMKHGEGLYVFAQGGSRLQLWQSGDLMSEETCSQATHLQYDEVRRKLLLKVRRYTKEFKPDQHALAALEFGLGT